MLPKNISTQLQINSSTLSIDSIDTNIYMKYDPIISIRNSTNKLTNHADITIDSNYIEESDYMDMGGNNNYLKKDIDDLNSEHDYEEIDSDDSDSDDSDYVDFHKYYVLSDKNKSSFNKESYPSNINDKNRTLKENSEVSKFSSSSIKIKETTSFSDEQHKIGEENYRIKKQNIKNELLTNEIIGNEELVNDMSHKELDNKNKNKSKIERYFSLIELVNKSSDAISPKIKELLNKEINLLKDNLKSDFFKIKEKIIIKLSELINHPGFKNKLLLKTNEFSLNYLINKEDKGDYLLTTLFSKVAKEYHKSINSSKVKDINKINEISNAIISLAIAQYDKEGII